MYRSSSWTRVADDFYTHRMADQYYMHSSPKEAQSLMEGNELPAYDPLVEMANKEKSRIKFAENAVHIIPFVLLLCGFILWFFSNPDIVVGIKGDTVAARIEGLTIEGDIDTDSDGTQTGFLPVEVEDLDIPKHAREEKYSRKLGNGYK
ncbi:hypothetical protein Tsubulata_039975 [Turnera subulata]|uniref:Uncharacterized protein n=1 Tax=Turnera subulata TaxID=218843 RepID=A0A9Q0GD65_9ROSI|nr:hypothetical protein Tsubulata_039975 [Turnera subulata]